MFVEEMSCKRYDKKECKEQKEHHSYKIGTWNIRTLKQGGKLENLKTEKRKNEVSVLGVSEVRWKGQGKKEVMIIQCTIREVNELKEV